MPAEAARPRQCPRLIGTTDGPYRLIPCGEFEPCPYHGSSLHLVAPVGGTDGEPRGE